MKKIIWKFFVAIAATTVGAGHADEFPGKTVRLIVPYAVGGTTDFTARLLAEKLTRKWGVAVIVENKAGANGNIGTLALARSPADGYTFGIVASQHAASPTLFSKLPFAISDFRTLTIATQSRMGLLTRRDFPAKDIKQLISLAKANPEGLTAAIAGSASVNNLWLKSFEKSSETKFHSIPFRGSGPAHLELLSGRVDVMFDVPSVVLPHIENKRMKLLAIGGDGRAASTPDVPTLNELGYPIGKTMLTWSALLIPARTPSNIAEKMSRDIIEILNQTEVKDKLNTIGLEVIAKSSQESERFMASEVNRIGQIILENNITPE